MDEKEKSSEDAEHQESRRQKHFYALFSTTGDLKLIKSNLPSHIETELEKVLTQRLQKALLFGGQGTIIFLEPMSERESEPASKAACYYYYTESPEETSETEPQYLICLISDYEEALDLFHTDLDHYCKSMVPELGACTLTTDTELPDKLAKLFESWHANAVEYLLRCKAALQDNLKYLIHSALLSHKLVTSGGTSELQTDLQRFYEACSLSDILSQLKEMRQDTESLSGSIDMLVDASRVPTDTQVTLTVSITEDSLKLDSNGCNKFCEEWANALNRPEFQNNPAKLKHVIEVFKLKFIQTMNTLKRLLREADNDYYALYRSFRFLRDSGNSEILLRYITAETGSDTADVLHVLQDFLQEQAV